MKEIANLWRGFLGWKGWSACAGFFGKLWRVCVGWTGWKVLFGLPFFLVAALCLLCGAGLIWVFLQGKSQWVPAYILYGLSAYSLTALCVQLPAGIRGVKAWLDRHPRISEKLENKGFRFALELYFEQLINFGYGIFKIAAGAMAGSAWIGCDGIYNLTQALIQLFQILRRKNPGDLKRQWRSYRTCGVLILLMHLTLTGIVFQMVNWNRVEDHGSIMIFATAAFAFYKIIKSFIEIAKDRKHTHPVDSSVRMLELAQAIFAMFSLQASLLHGFGTGEGWEHGLNLATGCTVCLLVCATGVYMIRRGNREIRKIEENQDGE